MEISKKKLLLSIAILFCIAVVCSCATSLNQHVSSDDEITDFVLEDSSLSPSQFGIEENEKEESIATESDGTGGVVVDAPILQVSNEKGEASFTMGSSVEDTLNEYAKIAKLPPSQESIEILQGYGDFPPDDYADYADGYYGGPAPGGDINDEVVLSFYNDKLVLIQIYRIDGEELKSDFLLRGIEKTTSLENAIFAFGAEPDEVKIADDYNEYRFDIQNNGKDCSIWLRYDKTDSVINDLGIRQD